METPRTQADVRKENFNRVADHARALAELAMRQIDEALDGGYMSSGEASAAQLDVLASEQSVIAQAGH